MARTITEIKNALIVAAQADPVLGALLTSTSRTALWRLWIYVQAVNCWALENNHDSFKADVNEIIDNMKSHRPLWYVNKAKDFQYGFNLVPEYDYYDNTGIDEDTIANSKIVAYAAFDDEPFVRMKVAKRSGNDLAKLSVGELAAFVAYILRIKDAGVKLKTTTITSTDPDNLKLTVRIIYNPLVIKDDGSRVDGTSLEPVKDAVKDYLQHLDFNGEFSVQKLVDRLQQVEGVEDLHIDLVQTQYGTLPFTNVDISFIPDSGYLIIDNADLTLTYIAEA